MVCPSDSEIGKLGIVRLGEIGLHAFWQNFWMKKCNKKEISKTIYYLLLLLCNNKLTISYSAKKHPDIFPNLPIPNLPISESQGHTSSNQITKMSVDGARMNLEGSNLVKINIF